MNPQVPHFLTVVLFCAIAVAFYAGFSVYIVAFTKDAALQGDVIGTWKSFATAAFFFWVGASSGGKIKDLTVPRPNDRDPLDLAGAEVPDTGARA